MSEFNGFPKEMIVFFNALKKNNRKEWFEAHKDDYENYVKGPAGDFVVAMGQKLQQHSPRINAIPKLIRAYSESTGIRDSATTKPLTKPIWAYGFGRVSGKGWSVQAFISTLGREP